MGDSRHLDYYDRTEVSSAPFGKSQALSSDKRVPVQRELEMQFS
jgi:hypothetical protein